jgi:hypothetical protein
MKTKVSVLIATIATSMTLTCLQSSPTLAQSKPSRFYCGSTDQQEPATMLVTKGQSEEKTFIVWKKNSSNNKERCRSVSRAFQKAWEQNNRSLYFSAGANSKGKSLICGVNSKGKSCLTKNSIILLVDLESKSQAQTFANQLESIVNGQEESPIEQ